MEFLQGLRRELLRFALSAFILVSSTVASATVADFEQRACAGIFQTAGEVSRYSHSYVSKLVSHLLASESGSQYLANLYKVAEDARVRRAHVVGTAVPEMPLSDDPAVMNEDQRDLLNQVYQVIELPRLPTKSMRRSLESKLLSQFLRLYSEQEIQHFLTDEMIDRTTSLLRTVVAEVYADYLLALPDAVELVDHLAMGNRLGEAPNVSRQIIIIDSKVETYKQSSILLQSLMDEISRAVDQSDDGKNLPYPISIRERIDGKMVELWSLSSLEDVNEAMVDINLHITSFIAPDEVSLVGPRLMDFDFEEILTSDWDNTTESRTRPFGEFTFGQVVRLDVMTVRNLPSIQRPFQLVREILSVADGVPLWLTFHTARQPHSVDNYRFVERAVTHPAYR